MKRFLLLAVGCLSLFCFVREAAAQVRCFYAVARNDTVEIRWCPPVETNFYGAYVQRRLRGETLFSPRPCFLLSSCPPLLGECVCIDVVPFAGVWQYRMQLIDLDGTVTYTDPINVLVHIVTGVGEEKPLRFSLNQNYPNPFNPTTEIRYQTPEVSRVNLKVFDVLGREVATLVNEVKQPGTYTVQWEASGVTSGVYLYRLTVGSFVETKKMLLIR